MNEDDKFLYFKQAFSTLSDEETKRLASFFQPKSFKKGEQVFTEGEVSPIIAFVKSGLTKMYLHTFEGKEYISAFFRDGRFFMNFYSIMAGTPSPFHVQAIENCELLIANYFDLNASFSDSLKWHKLKEKLYHQNFLIKVNREVQLLSYDAKERYMNLKRDRPYIIERVSQQNIALFLGITPVSLNRIIKSLEN